MVSFSRGDSGCSVPRAVKLAGALKAAGHSPELIPGWQQGIESHKALKVLGVTGRLRTMEAICAHTRPFQSRPELLQAGTLGPPLSLVPSPAWHPEPWVLNISSHSVSFLICVFFFELLGICFSQFFLAREMHLATMLIAHCWEPSRIH